MFTRQHYEKFAALIKKMQSKSDKEMLTNELLIMFKADNHRFDRDTFVKAAGLDLKFNKDLTVSDGVKNETKLSSLLPTRK